MALLRNREVSIVSRTDGADMSPVYTVAYPNGSRENAKLSELQLTKEEYGNMLRQNGEVYMHNVKRIEDKDLQEIRDSQDRKKIEERQNSKPKDQVVEKEVKVSPTETEIRKVDSKPLPPVTPQTSQKATQAPKAK